MADRESKNARPLGSNGPDRQKTRREKPNEWEESIDEERFEKNINVYYVGKDKKYFSFKKPEQSFLNKLLSFFKRKPRLSPRTEILIKKPERIKLFLPKSLNCDDGE